MDVNCDGQARWLRAIEPLPRVSTASPYSTYEHDDVLWVSYTRYSADFFDGAHNIVVRDLCFTMIIVAFHSRRPFSLSASSVVRMLLFRGLRRDEASETGTSATIRMRGSAAESRTTRTEEILRKFTSI